MSDVALETHGLSKRYRLGVHQTSYGRLTESLWGAMTSPFRRGGETNGSIDQRRLLWAIKDISLDVGHGEVVGIIGRNGAGKTTLLKVLSRITEPTEGEAIIHGRVGSLLEVGTGFHPELTGAENIYLNGAILGMRRTEIQAKFDDIVEFAEIGDFIDTPVKRYSSGMYVRLAFAVAAHLEPEILIIDEVLAVGDVSFQKKCLGKMDEVAKGGRTVLFVSHNMGAVRSLCTRAVYLERGQVVHDGPTDETVNVYLERMYDQSESHVRLKPRDEVNVQAVELWMEQRGERVGEIEMGTDLDFCFDYEIRRAIRDVTMAVLVTKDGQSLFYTYDVDLDESLRARRESGRYRARVPLPTSLFKEGAYTISVAIGAGRENLTDQEAMVLLNIVNNERDAMNRSYRVDRPGVIFREVPWETEQVSGRVPA